MPLTPLYRARRTGMESESIAALWPALTVQERALSPAFYECYASGENTGALTPFAGVEREWNALSRSDLPRSAPPLQQALTKALPGTVHVAVSGGIDGWVLALLLREQGHAVRAWTLRSGVAGYCEWSRTEAIARSVRMHVEPIDVEADAFVVHAAHMVRAAEMPIYNMHPVSKWLLARSLQERGVEHVITGDGADQVFRHDVDCDLLPITIRCFQAAGVRLTLPYLDPRVMASISSPYSDKQPLRALAEALGIPRQKKQTSLFPDDGIPTQPRAVLPIGGARECLSWTTALLLAALDQRACAA